jgi:hypothetical protein
MSIRLLAVVGGAVGGATGFGGAVVVGAAVVVVGGRVGIVAFIGFVVEVDSAGAGVGACRSVNASANPMVPAVNVNVAKAIASRDLKSRLIMPVSCPFV